VGQTNNLKKILRYHKTAQKKKPNRVAKGKKEQVLKLREKNLYP